MFALILASIIDIPSVISIISAIKFKKLWQVVLVAVFSAVLGDIMLGVIKGYYPDPILSPHRLVGQLIVALTVFGVAVSIRNRKSSKPEGVAFYKIAIVIVLILFSIGIAYGVYRGITLTAEDYTMKEHEVLLREYEQKMLNSAQDSNSRGFKRPIPEETIQIIRKAEALNFSAIAQVAFQQDNVAFAFVSEGHHVSPHEVDSNFNIIERKDITDTVPFEYRNAFGGAVSEAHALEIRQEIIKDIQRRELLRIATGINR